MDSADTVPETDTLLIALAPLLAVLRDGFALPGVKGERQLDLFSLPGVHGKLRRTQNLSDRRAL